MIFEMQVHNEPTTINELESFEKQHDIFLAKVYKDFLLSQNGGMPVNCLFEYDVTKGSCVDFFFGVNLSSSNLDLNNNVDVYSGRLPPGFLPIGQDPGGNLICMDSDSGSIYFWFHEAETDPPTMDNMYLIANSFDEFLLSLKPEEGKDWY